MSRPARFRPEALADLRAIARWIAGESRSIRTAERFTAHLREQCRQLAMLPGTPGTAREELGPGLRSLPWRDYVILFRYLDGRVQVVRILHGQRDLPSAMKPPSES